MLAKVAVIAGPAVIAGLVASVVSFLLGQQILHGNGFVPAHGYPTVSIADGPAARAIVGTALYLAAIALFAFAIGTIVRRTGPAIAIVLAFVYVPAIVSLMLAEPIRGWVQKASPMMAGLAVQRTVLRADSVPIGTRAGLGVAAAWSAIALVAALWLVRRRDA
jgi:ABC-2 type transport system permease protein